MRMRRDIRMGLRRRRLQGPMKRFLRRDALRRAPSDYLQKAIADPRIEGTTTSHESPRLRGKRVGDEATTPHPAGATLRALRTTRTRGVDKMVTRKDGNKPHPPSKNPIFAQISASTRRQMSFHTCILAQIRPCRLAHPYSFSRENVAANAKYPSHFARAT